MRYDTTISAVDDDSFASLLADASVTALRVATVVLGTEEGADDVVQVAMERAWRARHTYDAGRPFPPWLLRIVANTARNSRRQRGRLGALRLRAASRAEPTAGVTPEDEAITADDQRLVLAALNRLDPGDRLVLALRFVEQLGESEVAEVLDCPVGTVKSRAARAKARLRAELGGR